MTSEIKKFKVPAETIILGFTGSLGSGCSFVSKEVAKMQGFLHYELSSPINEKAARDNDLTIAHKQQIGNSMRRESGFGVLAQRAMESAEVQYDSAKHNGIVLAGIRNVGEVEVLRQFPNFFLFSVHAEKEARFARLQKAGRVENRGEFEEVDLHDSEENLSHGQQVKLCNDKADIIFNNDKEIASSASAEREDYVRTRFVRKYVELIRRLIAGEHTLEFRPSADEMFMTMAYCESSRSTCQKRRVGAVVANVHMNSETGTERGFTVSSEIGRASCRERV